MLEEPRELKRDVGTTFLSTAFPRGTDETAAYLTDTTRFGTACSTTSSPLVGAMSTAQVARDMDVLRRAVGDTKLTYLASPTAPTWATSTPTCSRTVSALAIDGVIDPVAWQGSAETAAWPMTQRMASGDGAWKSLRQILASCATAGKGLCMTAQLGNAQSVYEKTMAGLKAKPIEITDGDEVLWRITFADAINVLLGDMYDMYAWAWVDSDLYFLRTMQLELPSSAKGKAANAALAARYKARQTAANERQTAHDARVRAGFGFPYINQLEAYQSVLCSDGTNPAFGGRWTKAIKNGTKAPGFGALWSWASAPCASKTWTRSDEDAYRGTFDHRTANPVLVVGSYWDPATNYQAP